MDLLEDLRMTLSNFNFDMIYIIHKIFELIENDLNHLKDNIFKFKLTDFYFLKN